MTSKRRMDKLDKTLIGSLLLAALFSSAVSDDWKASVTKNLDALVTSCVVVPCSFSHPGKALPSSKLRGIWHISNDKNQVIYNEDQTKILDPYKDRTKMLGQLGQNNCTLEIADVKDHDNGPFCFRIELVGEESQKFSFVQDCVDLKMQRIKPNLSRAAFEGKTFTVTCSVRHTCPSFRPKLSWSRGNADQIFEKHEEISPGIWVMESVLTFVPEEKDDHSQLNCTAVFHGGKTTTKTLHLYVKRKTFLIFFSLNCVTILYTPVQRSWPHTSSLPVGAANYKNIIIPIVVVWNRMSRFSRR
uniref:Ig-like domain-containing protein n=1 Tax=Oryzias melastigma TaxID=30732 RepID=A0A3B3CHC3_ORYME